MEVGDQREVDDFLEGRVARKTSGRPRIPRSVTELVERALASPQLLREIPYINDDWIKVAGFRRGSMDVAVDGSPIVPVVVRDLIRLGQRLPGGDEAAPHAQDDSPRKPVVSDDEWRFPAGASIAHNKEELVRLCHGDVENVLSIYGDYECEVRFEEDGVELYWMFRGIGLTYPFTIDDLLEAADDVEAEIEED